MSDYLHFKEVPSGTKTKKWYLISKSTGYNLGMVKWYGPWKQYCFFPNPGTIWNIACLECVNKFIERHKKERN